MVTSVRVETISTNILVVFDGVVLGWCPGLLFGILLGSLWAVQEGVFFQEAYDALMLVETGGVVAGAMVVEVIAHLWPLF